MNIYEQVSRNRRLTWYAVGGFVLFFLALGYGLDRFYGAGVPAFSVAALAFAGVSSFAGYRYGDRLVLASCAARPLDRSDPRQAQWQNVVEEMSLAAGIPVPAAYFIDDPDPNAFATGRSPRTASIAVTRGLLENLSRDELQAVAGHEISHIKNFDIRLMLLIAVLVGAIALISDWATRSLFHSGRRDRRENSEGAAPVAMLVWLACVILAPLLSQLMAMFVSRRREYLADASGAELTRNPLALAGALEKIAGHRGPTRSVNRGTAHLCIADPAGHLFMDREGGIADLFATHPPIQKRIDLLKQMGYAG